MTRHRSLLSAGEQNESEIEPAFGREDEEFVDQAVAEDAVEEEYWEEEEASAAPRGTWIVPTIAILAILGWTGFFAWVHQSEILAGASPERWTQWIATWSMPVLLVIGLWLLAMRNSRREANRFTDAARALGKESADLEARLLVVNRELSLARDFIASQALDLESLGRVATERLNESAGHLEALIRDNSDQVETIGTVSANAVANMENLRDQIPVLSTAARDMSNQIGGAGTTAHAQIEALVAGFDRLNQFGEAGERHVDSVREKVTATLEAFDMQVAALGEVTQTRFDKLREISESFRTDMVESEDAALASIRTRADELVGVIETRHAEQRAAEGAALASLQQRLAEISSHGEALLGSLDEGRETAAASWREAVDALELRMQGAVAKVSEVDEAAMASARHRLAELAAEAGRTDERIAASMAAFDTEMARRREEASERHGADLAELENSFALFDERIAGKREAYLAVTSDLTERSDALAARLGETAERLETLSLQGARTDSDLGDAAETLAGKLATSRAMIDENATRIAKLTDDGVRLLEIIRSGADHSQGALGDAIGQAEARLSGFGEEAARLAALVGEAEASGERLSAHVGEAGQSGERTLDQLKLLEERVAAISTESERLAERTGNELREALQAMTGSTDEALANLRGAQAEIVNEIAGSVAAATHDKVVEAIRVDAAASIAELEEAVALSAERGRETTAELREQLAQVTALADNLEQRVAHAREMAGERVDGDFSKRMALITDALNSSAIDIAKAFDTEVSDTQWAHYLRGDRGIFTRRAVRLLDRSEARGVAEIYEEDGEFRETVNRFIHDFEAMLREVLATRDGHALAVTLLSSDMGKLYVALAQAIERLRN
ncbi:MAG: ATPase [Alteraurantiacibacter sp.]